ncbi:hypothetical protein BDV95DRAFT_584777 [Massariosphaeria phaeospora]|uniref:Uncharacterized protein n=1 Tax=Massariosphaeria phaeospora TaxID=100035 RepID=A0A7C8I0R6_9PLEO|nr:hypothetical protein BDV95DRAFT_584777 [Massariosphaeria phaeospora]
MEQLTLRHSVTVADLETNLRDQRSAHGTALDRQEQDNERVVRHLKSEHEKKIKDADADHKAMIQALTTSQEEERNRLIGQLLVNQDNIQEWPDEKLKAKFLELQCIVGSIGSPQREELKFPQDIPVGPDLDPTGFFDRNKRGRGHFLVKRAVWAILCEHFFSVPFGFGVLGPENTQNELLSNFQEWRRLCRIGGPSQTEDAVDLTVFENDDLANRWRTISFRSIQDSGTVNLRSPIHELRAKNAASSTARIMQYLSAVASLTQHSINISVEDEVRKATQLAEEIALQFGVHPSKLLLRTADETWNGDPAPGLLKIGRDKNNTPTAQTVVPCKGSSDK